MPAGPSLTRWPFSETPSAARIETIFREEGLSPYSWSNGPGDFYAEHEHAYHKVLYCVRGSIKFVADGRGYEILPGDRLDLPPRTRHSAIVGREGVTCIEAARIAER